MGFLVVIFLSAVQIYSLSLRSVIADLVTTSTDVCWKVYSLTAKCHLLTLDVCCQNFCSILKPCHSKLRPNHRHSVNHIDTNGQLKLRLDNALFQQYLVMTATDRNGHACAMKTQAAHLTRHFNGCWCCRLDLVHCPHEARVGTIVSTLMERSILRKSMHHFNKRCSCCGNIPVVRTRRVL